MLEAHLPDYATVAEAIEALKKYLVSCDRELL
jgi:hypothetical protein